VEWVLSFSISFFTGTKYRISGSSSVRARTTRTYWVLPSFLYHLSIVGLLDERLSFMPINPVVTPSKIEQFTGFI